MVTVVHGRDVAPMPGMPLSWGEAEVRGGDSAEVVVVAWM